MTTLTDAEIVAACLTRYRAVAPAVWGFAWLPDTLDCLLRSQLAAQPRAVTAVGPALAGALLAGAVQLLEDVAARAAVRRCLTDPALRVWWRRWEATDPAEQPVRTDTRPDADHRGRHAPLAPR